MWNQDRKNQNAAAQVAAIQPVKYLSRAQRYLLRMPAWRVGVWLLELVAITIYSIAVIGSLLVSQIAAGWAIGLLAGVLIARPVDQSGQDYY